MTPTTSTDPRAGAPGGRFTPDWERGSYEDSAPWLRPAAATVLDHAVEAIGPLRGRHVVDVGCGSGNGALLAALRGARATGVDPAARLLRVARAGAHVRGLSATFLHGDAADLPLQDASADAVVSIFGVIFAPEADEVAAELARVTADDGCIVLSAWPPEGPLREANDVPRRAVMEALDLDDAPAGFAWHDPDEVAALLAPHGFSTAFARHEVVFTAPSLEAFLEIHGRHPYALAARDVLEPRGLLRGMERRLRAVLDAANENPAAFRMTVPYVVATARRG